MKITGLLDKLNDELVWLYVKVPVQFPNNDVFTKFTSAAVILNVINEVDWFVLFAGEFIVKLGTIVSIVNTWIDVKVPFVGIVS